MTRAEILALKPGDCVMGFAGDWNDEQRVLECWEPRKTGAGKTQRRVRVQFGYGATLTGFVTEGNDEIRSIRI